MFVNENKTKNKEILLYIGIFTHIILIGNIFIYFFYNPKIKYNIFYIISFLLGHTFILINLIKDLLNFYKKNVKIEKNKFLFHFIGHINLFIFGILLFIKEKNKISKTNNYINLLYILNQFIFVVLLIFLNYNKIKNENIEFTLFNIIFILFIIIFSYKIIITNNNKLNINITTLFIVLFYIIYLHANLF